MRLMAEVNELKTRLPELEASVEGCVQGAR